MISDPTHHWSGVPPDIDNYYGFIYIIKNNISGKMYIGKKQYFFHRKIRVKGRKNRKTYIKESDWRFYTGSCKGLNKDIASLGKDNFTFAIMYHAKSKGMLHWLEIETQVRLNVLKEKDDNGDRLYYNGMIAGIKFIPKDEYPEISEMQKGKNNTIFKAIANGNHPTLGKGHSDAAKEKMSIRTGDWWKNLPEDEKLSIKDKLSESFKGTKNHKFQPWAYKEPGGIWVEVFDKTIKDWCIENNHPKVKIRSFKPPRKKSAYWAGWEFKILGDEDEV